MIYKIARGANVKMRGHLGSVFWSGACKHTGRARIGMEDNTGLKHWGFSVECEIVDPALEEEERYGSEREEVHNGISVVDRSLNEIHAMYGDD